MYPHGVTNGEFLFKGTHRIASARLREWDYSTPGFYFVTVCTKEKICVFGEIIEIPEDPGAKILLSSIGRIVEKCWLEIPKHYPNVSLDVLQIMPNHVHGIVFIEEQKSGVTLGLIMNQFKAACTKQIRETGYQDFAWQERFYDHIVRNEKDSERIQKYVFENPAAWLRGEDAEQ